VGIHINMPLAMPSLSNPLHLLQLANSLLAPSVPLLLSAKEIQGLQVGAWRREGDRLGDFIAFASQRKPCTG